MSKNKMTFDGVEVDVTDEMFVWVKVIENYIEYFMKWFLIVWSITLLFCFVILILWIFK